MTRTIPPLFLALLVLAGCASPYGVESRLPQNQRELSQEDKVKLALQRERMQRSAP